MQTFLQLVADDLRQRTGGNFAHTLVVFPGKRASLFLDEYLAKDSTPLWSPRYTTISELFRLFCPLAPADPIETACRIHRIYTEVTKTQGGTPDTLDRFYGWAERLLADFDDVDKALVDARSLFINIGDLQEIEAKDFLNEQQREVLSQFFKDFDPQHSSTIRDRFLQLWRGMPEIYDRLQKELESEGLAYSGMLHRRAVENLENGTASLPQEVDCVAIVGFNVLSAVERKLFKLLTKETKTLFYWDYDTFYVGENGPIEMEMNEAGYFMRQNLHDFPNALQKEAFSNLMQPKQINFVSATSNNAQARFISPWLKKNLTADARQTAVVLCEEDLLQPVLHALPEQVKSINITKGYPLAATDSYAVCMRQAEVLEKEGKDALQFVKELQDSVGKKEEEGENQESVKNDTIDILEQEARFQIFTILERFAHLVETGTLNVSIPTLRRLIKQVLRRQSVPFHGEPVEGLQIMGMLETRCLDFESVLILSADDNHLPRAEADNSFIPYFLRKAYGLNTKRHNAAVYAYYFYRLLSRAKNVAAVWSVGGDGTQGGEMSRFMTQLLIEAPGLHIKRTTLQAQSTPTAHQPISIPKPANIVEKLGSLSPSALNEYLDCPAKFFFRRISNIKAWEEPTEGLAANHFGSIFHRAAEFIYKYLSNNKQKPVYSTDISKLLSNTSIVKQYIKDAFDDVKMKEKTLVGELKDYPVENEVLLRMIKDLLRTDEKLSRIVLIMMEEKQNTSLVIKTSNGEQKITINGYIDRLDQITDASGNELVRVLDYKTGTQKSQETFNTVDELFKRDPKRARNTFQTFIYSLTVENTTELPLRPALHYTANAHKPDYDSYVKLGKDKLDNIRPLLKEFRALLTELVEEICDTEQPFVARPSETVCSHCHYKHICLH